MYFGRPVITGSSHFYLMDGSKRCCRFLSSLLMSGVGWCLLKINNTTTSSACRCDGRTTAGCEMGSGRCICKPQFSGPNCDACADGYIYYPQCIRELPLALSHRLHAFIFSGFEFGLFMDAGCRDKNHISQFSSCADLNQSGTKLL